MSRKSASIISLSSFAFLLISLILFFLHSAFERQPSFDIIIENGTVVDGSGTRKFAADIGIRGENIAAIGNLKDHFAVQRIDATGLIVAPGFIDLANHSTDALQSRPGAEPLIKQGITTVLLNSDGGTHREIWPLYTWLHQFELKPAAVNIAAAVAYGTVRRPDVTSLVDTLATDDFLAVYEKLTAALQQGAYGISASLSFGPARHAQTAELHELLRFARENNTLALVTLRTPMRQPATALKELFALNKTAPVVLSQSQPVPEKIWPLFFEQDTLGEAMPTVFISPYSTWIGPVTDLVPQGEQFNWREIRRALWMAGGASRITIARSKTFPQFVGRSLGFMAKKMDMSAQRAFMQLVKDKTALLSFRTIREEHFADLLRSERSIIVTDGGMDIPRPASFAAFPYLLGNIVRDRQLISIEQAIAKITSAPASLLGLTDRGRIVTGAKADLVLFAPTKINAVAAEDGFSAHPVGIETVLVNGKIVFDHGVFFDLRPGHVLRKQPLPLVTSR